MLMIEITSEREKRDRKKDGRERKERERNEREHKLTPISMILICLHKVINTVDSFRRNETLEVRHAVISNCKLVFAIAK